MSEHKIDLSALPWFFRQVKPKEDFKNSNLLLSDGWMKAKVPGNIYLDLMANRLISDPRWNLGQDLSWVDKSDWLYGCSFTVNSLKKGNDCELSFEGLDTVTDIWLNGCLVGSAKNMFINHSFRVDNLLLEGDNTLVIHFKSALKWTEEARKENGRLPADHYPDRIYLRKMQCSFGWDFGLSLPGCGIWQPCCLQIRSKNHPRVRRVVVNTQEIIGNKAVIAIDVFLENHQQIKKIIYAVIDQNGTLCRKWSYQEGVPENICHHLMTLDKIKLWWPHDLGRSHLYHLRIELIDQDGKSHLRIYNFGVRTVRLARGKSEGFRFLVNNKFVFIKGANFVPADIFLTDRKDKNLKLLEMAKKAGFNLIRVWGGGVYEEDDFYQTCDKLGLMVWQDFMFACGHYPNQPDFVTEIEREAEQVVRRLANHPSIVVWCGNNECEMVHLMTLKERIGLKEYFYHFLPNLLRQTSPNIPYVPTTPLSGIFPFTGDSAKGDIHLWGQWSFGWRFESYLKKKFGFVSEFGWQALPSWKVFEKSPKFDSIFYNDKHLWQYEKQKNGKLIFCWYFWRYFGKTPKWLGDWIILSQILQAKALTTAINAWLKNSPQASGFILWQLNDICPSISWSIIDYELQPKIAYRQLRELLKPGHQNFESLLK
ncbi:MAG: sugar-binding domain-containing protein [Patescibacteria group bacterium]